MSVPTLIAEVMFNSPTWTDISPYVRSATVRRGSSRVDSPTLRYEAGTAVLKLDNRDRRFDPTNLFGPYVGGSGGAGTTGTYLFTNTLTQTFGVGLTLDIKSVSAVTQASIVNVTSKATGTTGSFTVDKPSGTALNDRIVIIHFADIGTLASLGTPTGGASWGTALTSVSQGDDTIQGKVWIKTAGGSEPATYGMTQDSGADGVAFVITIRNADNADTPVFAWFDNAEQSVFTTPSTTPNSTNDLELRACGGTTYGEGGSSWTANPLDGFAELGDKQSSVYTNAALFSKALTAVGGGSAGTSTRVLPMRPVRLQATWNFTATTNLIQNPSFEVDTTGWVASTNTTINRVRDISFVGGYGLEVRRTVTNPPFNAYSAKATGTAAGAVTGNTVTLSAYVRIPAASLPKISGVMIGGIGTTFDFAPTDGLLADQWYRVSRTVVLSATLDDVEVQFWTDNTHADGQVIGYVDAVQAEVRSSASPYCDGDQPACTWTGTAHNSSTTRPATFTFPLFRGFVDSWDIEWTADVDSEVSLPCTDGFKVMGSVDRIALGAPVGVGELTSARITRILDSISWPAGERAIGTGGSTTQGTTLPDNALTEIFLVTDSELGEFYMDAAGLATYRGRAALFSDTRSVNFQASFGDGGTGAGEIPYHDVVISYDDVQLYNDAHISITGGASQNWQDAASVADYLVHTFERTDLVLQSNADALSYAQWIVYISKDPELRFDQLIVRPQKQEDDLFPQVLKREIGDRIKVARRPPGGGAAVIREVFIRGMELTIEQYFWEMTYNLQSASRVGSFLTLNHSTLGKIGRNALRF